MNNLARITSFILVILLALGTVACSSTDYLEEPPTEEAIKEETQNNEEPDSVAIEPLELPNIVLYREGDAGEGIKAIQKKLIDPILMLTKDT